MKFCQITKRGLYDIPNGLFWLNGDYIWFQHCYSPFICVRLAPISPDF